MSFMIFQNEKKPFQAIKTRSPKSRKMDIFPKGLTHGFCPKMANFSNFFFQEIKAMKMSFTIFQSEKTPFQPIKTRSSKSRKIDIFPKGVNPWFQSKNSHFSNFFFQGIQARKMSFTIFQSEKPTSQAIKRKSSNSRKIDNLAKGLTHSFGPKMAIFFFFEAIQTRKITFIIFQCKKTPFQAIKTRSPKSQKISIFRTGLTLGFGSKMAIFPTFFFRQYRPGKCLL